MEIITRTVGPRYDTVWTFKHNSKTVGELLEEIKEYKFDKDLKVTVFLSEVDKNVGTWINENAILNKADNINIETIFCDDENRMNKKIHRVECYGSFDECEIHIKAI